MSVLAQVAVGGAFINVSTVVRHAHLSVAFRADAHERADEVLAGEFAVVGRSGAFVHVLTVSTICGQSVAVRANATEGARHVVATEGALVAHFLALVNVLADLHGSRSESIRAVAFESSLHIGAGTVPANVGHGAFVIICRSTHAHNYLK